MPPTSSAPLRNAFSSHFLERLDRLPEPDGAHEAWTAGPWAVAPVVYLGSPGFALFRQGESLADGDSPHAIFRRRQTALLAAAVLPSSGRDPLYHLQTEPDPAGFPLRADAQPDPPRPRPATSAQGSANERTEAAGASTAAEVSERGDLDKTGGAHEPSDADDPSDAANALAWRAASAYEFDAGAVGHLRDFDEDLVAALHVAAMLARSPTALAYLLEAAGAVCLEQAGKILDRRLQ